MTEERIVVTVIDSCGTKELLIRAGENLLMALVKANFPVDFTCTTGKCTICRLRILKTNGTITEASDIEVYRLGPEAISKGYRLTCQVYVNQPLLVNL